MADIIESGHLNDKYDNTNEKESLVGKWNCMNLITAFAGGSSIQAVSQVGQASTKGRKTLWLLVLILCIYSCIFQVNSFLLIYFQYPVLIDVVVQNNGSLEFPAVTVCNLNRMKRYHTDCVKDNLKWSACKRKVSKTRVLVFSERKKFTHVSNATDVLKRGFQSKSQEFFNHYTGMDAVSRKCYGYRIDDLVRRCSFNSLACSYKDFTYFNSLQYGNCFTFNRNTQDGQEPLTIRKIGPNSGLELDLDLQPDSYLDFTPATAARVVLHNPQEDPNPGENGINISPGYETHVSMLKTSVQRLPPPYRDRCKDYKAFNYNDTSMGSQFDCIRNCMQHTSLSTCGCVDPFLPTVQRMTPCNLKNATQMLCLDRILEYMSDNGLPCECPLPCMSTMYDLQVSMTIISSPSSLTDSEDFGWSPDSSCEYNPAIIGNDDVSQYSGSPLGREKTNKRGPRHVSQSAFETKAKLRVFYRSLEHTIYAQKPMFSDAELYGQLGGNLSLWLGLSVVAMFEYAEKICLLIRFVLQKKKSTGN